MSTHQQQAWRPKQVPEMTPARYQLIGGLTTMRVAEHVFTTLLPPLPPDTYLHDAAAGQGAFLRAALSSCPAASLPSLRALATDTNAGILEAALQGVLSSGPEASSAVTQGRITFSQLDACSLSSVPNDSVTLSVLGFGLAVLADPVQAAAEMYRTTRPGGTAVTAFWTQQPSAYACLAAHEQMRGPGRKSAKDVQRDANKPEVLKAWMEDAGFHDVTMSFQTVASEVADAREYVDAMWSIVGESADGWRKEDEEDWDSCVDKALEILVASEGVEVLGGGRLRVEMIAMIAIAKK